ncbi:DUF6975 family protein, partial [Sphingomonas bacterium]|uniref:DUF6975 family protein n=1 Tax=Sphingomonas bacterium TaxID=1895847 RepID=UPI003F68A7ED
MADTHPRIASPAWDLVMRLAAADGVATHPFHARLLHRRVPARDLGDAMHALCAVHGHHPDLIEIVAGDVRDGAAVARALLLPASEIAHTLHSGWTAG